MTDLDLCYLPASEALRRFKAKKLSPVDLMKAVIARAEATKKKINCFTYTHFDEAMDLAKQGRSQIHENRRPHPRARRPADRHQGRELHRGQADLAGLAHHEGLCRQAYLADERADPEGGRHRPCQNRDARILLRRLHLVEALGRHPQSVESALYAGRLVGRHRGLACLRHLRDRHRLRYRRLDPHPGLDLRSRRLQAALWPQPGRSAVQSRFLLSYRAAGPQCRGCDHPAERHGGPEPARHRDPAPEADAADRLQADQGLEDRLLDDARRLRGRQGSAGRTRLPRSMSSARSAPRSRKSISAGRRKCSKPA